jgi:membrane-bound serine protease (ClpP class)
VKTGERGMLGERGTVLEWSDGRGRVLTAGERWHAVGDAPLAPGQRVRVVAVDGLVLRVVAES